MGAKDLTKLELSVGRWGNSLAVRLPAELVRALGVGEGDVLHLEAEGTGIWQMSAKLARPKMDKQELLAFLQKHLNSMPPTKSVIREMRDNARY